jgi:hypothetical protein
VATKPGRLSFTFFRGPRVLSELPMIGPMGTVVAFEIEGERVER